MSVLTQRIVHQRGLGVASVVGGAVFATLYVQQVAGAFASTVLLFLGTGQGSQLGQLPGLLVLYHLRTALPFAIGVFLCLWFIAPVGPQLRVIGVGARMLLAAGVGAVCTLIVTMVIGLGSAVGFSGEIFANSFPSASFEGSSVLYSLSSGVSIGIQQFLSSAPLAVLSGIFAWMWLQRHPSPHDATRPIGFPRWSAKRRAAQV